MLFPTPRRGVRSWWHSHVTEPLEQMYAALDEHADDEDGSQPDGLTAVFRLEPIT